MNKNEMNDNLIMFPSSKNFPPVGALGEAGMEFYLDDKLKNLDLNDSTLEFEDLDDSLRYSSFEEYMNRHNLGLETKVNAVDENRQEALKILLQEQIKLINETKAQMKYYLDEIDMFLPKRR